MFSKGLVATLGNRFFCRWDEVGLLLCHVNKDRIWNKYTGVEKVGKNSNSLLVYDGISHVLVAVHGIS